jgi:hypothetical protein
MAPKGPPNISSPTKPSESSTMTQEEREDIFHQMEHMKKMMGENMEQMENKMGIWNRWKRRWVKIWNQMENKMDKNMEEIKKYFRNLKWEAS